jgi:hypothetical protein
MKKTIIPRNDPQRVLWLNAFVKGLVKYADKYNILKAEVDAAIAMALFFAYWVSTLVTIRDFASKVTNFKNNMAGGVEPNAENPTAPVLPDLGAAPPIVIAGIFPFIMTLVKRIKAHKDYVTDDGDEMGIEGDEMAMEDVNSLKPVIKIVLVNGGFPELQWTKKSTDGVLIQVNRGSGWEFLAIDTIPDYIDTHALPAIGQSAVWQYRVIYRLNDENVGQWCEPISVTVTGA